ncbi:unnamed protein product [Enterobius vermicularis]|uniref:Uncharacterized protein n=1 Tax=Enterobius vermicularis TaxID=51028 RepID=A0A0N4VLH4_ENTVE|nr:unnamed protein product [Enterobius vermicularis]
MADDARREITNLHYKLQVIQSFIIIQTGEVRMTIISPLPFSSPKNRKEEKNENEKEGEEEVEQRKKKEKDKEKEKKKKKKKREKRMAKATQRYFFLKRSTETVKGKEWKHGEDEEKKKKREELPIYGYKHPFFYTFPSSYPRTPRSFLPYRPSPFLVVHSSFNPPPNSQAISLVNSSEMSVQIGEEITGKKL